MNKFLNIKSGKFIFLISINFNMGNKPSAESNKVIHLLLQHQV